MEFNELENLIANHKVYQVLSNADRELCLLKPTRTKETEMDPTHDINETRDSLGSWKKCLKIEFPKTYKEITFSKLKEDFEELHQNYIDLLISIREEYKISF